MICNGDVRLISTEDGGEIEIVSGQPLMDQGLETAVYISIFSGPDWWGNAISEPDEKVESEIENLYSSTLSNKTRLDAEEYVRKALAWMIRSGIAKKIEVSATLPAPGILGLDILITQPGDTVINLRYQINWSAQRQRMGL